jgi:hypothetical protein
LLVGEIGISRRELLYEVRFWEARRIIRGYRKRNRLTYQLLAENVFASTYAFRGSEGKTVKDMYPDIFDNEEEDTEPPMTDEESAELQACMAEFSKKLAQEYKEKSGEA